jgi:UDP-N-acetyl-D-glucosamine dehydrogenase
LISTRCAEVEAISVCVPTPLRKTKDPDISYIAASVSKSPRAFSRASSSFSKARPYPGTTDEMVVPASG